MGTYLLMVICNIILATAAVARPQNVEWPHSAHVVGLPYYGGARGQLLQITSDQNGAVLNQVVVPVVGTQQGMPAFFQTHYQDPMVQGFGQSFYNLQSSAQRLVDLQQKIQRQGLLMPSEKVDFNSNLALLGQSATQLAEHQTAGQDLTALFGAQQGPQLAQKQSQKINKNEEELQAEQFEEDVGEEQAVSGGDEALDAQDDTVQVNGPPDTASVAEAKPVGLAIAGEGGVASSKPSATAIVGPGGLAIARPVATAIAGVDPGQAGFPSKIPLASFKRRADQLLAGRRH